MRHCSGPLNVFRCFLHGFFCDPAHHCSPQFHLGNLPRPCYLLTMTATFPDPRSDTEAPSLPAYAAIGERCFGSVCRMGLWTLYCREVRRFARESLQTILAPVVTSLLFWFIFSYAFGDSRLSMGETSLIEFIIPGLAMMSLMQNAFSNSSFSLLISKYMGNVVDFLMSPLSPGELTLAFVAGATTRGIVVAFCVLAAMMLFHPYPVEHVWAVLYFGIGASLMLGQMGLLAGIWAERFDHLQGITNFIVTPLSFLSGTFYPLTVLPPAAQFFSQGNPFFYLIDGFRYGFIGHAESNIQVGVAMVTLLNIILWVFCHLAFRSGWRLKN